MELERPVGERIGDVRPIFRKHPGPVDVVDLVMTHDVRAEIEHARYDAHNKEEDQEEDGNVRS